MTQLKKLFSIALLSILAFSSISGSLVTNAASSPLLPGDSVLCKDNTGGETACGIGKGGSLTGGKQGIAETIISIARLLTYITGALAVLFVVYGGLRYLTAQDEKGAGDARVIIRNAVIGLVIAVVAFSIVSIVSGLLSGTFITN